MRGRWIAAVLGAAMSVGCGPQAMPKGAGATGAPIAVVPESANKVPDEVVNPQPGSGQGAGGGDGMGRLRFQDKGGKAHERGTGKNQRKVRDISGDDKRKQPPPAPKAVPEKTAKGL